MTFAITLDPLMSAVDPPDIVPILNALPHCVFTIGTDGIIGFVNLEAQEFFEAGAPTLVGSPLVQWMPPGTPVFNLIDQVRNSGGSVSEYSVEIDTPRIGRHRVSVSVAALGDQAQTVVVSLHERSIADQIDKQLTHRNAARSVTAMAAMLAHEVKNPLSGIRGAAQLLEQGASAADRELTQLICDEADRILGLVERVEVFSDQRPLERHAVNIHAVLDHVRKVAQNGFGRHVSIAEVYDPSLPEVLGNRDQLIQVFINLFKNACEAVPDHGGEIVVTTAYRHGMRLAIPGAGTRLHLPLQILVQDNGAGIPEDLQAHLFDPFVTTKRNGNGLGLALVAKIVGDHGGVIDFQSEPRRTVFKVSLPMVEDME